MASSTEMNAGEPVWEASVDALHSPTRDHQTDGGDHEPGLCWEKESEAEAVAANNNFFFDEAISPPIPIDPRYYEDPLTIDDDENDETDVMKLIPDLCASTSASDIYSHFGPKLGGLSYCYFSLANVDPVWFGKAFGEMQGHASNFLWLQAHVGAGFYIWTRRHIRTLPITRALLYSFIGSVLFNFGSCMVWGLGRSMLRASPNSCRLFGLASSCLLLFVAQDYLQTVDDKCTELD